MAESQQNLMQLQSAVDKIDVTAIQLTEAGVVVTQAMELLAQGAEKDANGLHDSAFPLFQGFHGNASDRHCLS